MEELRRSRRECFRADAGVPTWTGANGAKMPRFGKKGKAAATATATTSKFGDGSQSSRKSRESLSSADLLERMRVRNRFRMDEDDVAFQMGASQTEHSELLADIRNFVSFQADKDGEASTAELVGRFKARVPPKDSPLFKSLLNEICFFEKNKEVKGGGMWRLKAEFR